MSNVLPQVPTRSDCLAALADTSRQLPDRELRVLARIAHRLFLGNMQYGPLRVGKRNWRHEAAEELFDACVYLSCQLEGDEP